MEITKANKSAIVESKLQSVYASIYDCSLDVRVSKNCSDENMEKNAIARMKKLEAMKDELLKVKSEIESEKE